MNLKGKVAVVTGGSKGIGFAIAESLVKLGVSVLICGRNEHDLRSAINALAVHGSVDGVTCDVSNEDEVKEMLRAAVEGFGGIDILVNNAGIGYFGSTVEEMSSNDFRRTLETNLFGVFYACHHAIPLMKQRGGGYIFNISSLAGQNPHAKMAAYNASKFALNGFSEALMQEVRQDGIKVSYVCPGSVNTFFGGDSPDPSKAWQLQPEDIARVIVDLLNFDPRALPSKVEIRPSRPPKK